MNMHKRVRLTPLDREEIWRLYQGRQWKVTHLAEHCRVSRPTIYSALKKARLQQFAPSDSTNARYRSIQYGLKRLAKIELSIQARLKREAQRYNKSYPGEMVHVDTKRLPLIKGQNNTQPREYLFVAIDDYSRELYAAILPDKTQFSSAQFLMEHLLAQCPYEIDYIYSDNGKEYRGTPHHAFDLPPPARRRGMSGCAWGQHCAPPTQRKPQRAPAVVHQITIWRDTHAN